MECSRTFSSEKLRFQKRSRFMRKTSSLRARPLPLLARVGLYLGSRAQDRVLYSLCSHGDLEPAHLSPCKLWAPKRLRRCATLPSTPCPPGSLPDRMSQAPEDGTLTPSLHFLNVKKG